MRRSHGVDNSQRELLPFIKAHGASFMPTTSVGGSKPDGVVGFLCVDQLVEFKTGKAPLTEGQQEWHRAWRGARVWVLRTRDDVVAMLDDMRRRSRELSRI